MNDVAELAAGATGPNSVYRITIDWRQVQGPPPNQQPEPSWLVYDTALTAIDNAGMRPLLVLVGAPQWARSPLCTSPNPGTVCPPAGHMLWAWREFVKQTTLRYADPVSPYYVNPVGIELWNEPNKKTSWHTLTGPNPAEYGNVYAAGRDAINAVRSDMPIGVGGLFSAGQNVPSGDMTIPTFLNGVYDRLGTYFLDANDGISVHPYPGPTEITSFSPTGTLRGRLDETQGVVNVRDPGRALWVTEVGYSLAHGVSANDQACGVVNVLDELEALDNASTYNISFALIHSLIDFPGEQYGLVENTAGLPARPAYCHLAADSGQAPTPCVPPPTPPTC